MNHIKNQKYLKSNDLHYYIGWILIVIGVFLLAVGELLWLYILPFQFFISIGAIIIGAIVAFVPATSRSNEEEFDKEINERTESLIKRTTETLEKSLKNQDEAPTAVGRYLLDCDGVIIRKGRKDQKYRSSLYSLAVIAFKKNSLYILQNTFSLISDEKSEKLTEIAYTDAPEAQIQEREFTIPGTQIHRKLCELIIKDTTGTTIVIPVKNSVIIDELCDKINKTGKSHRRT